MSQSATNSALLAVDIQNDFTTKTGEYPIDLSQVDRIIININSLIDRSQQLDLTIVYIGNEYYRFDPLNIFRNFATIIGSEGSKLDSRLAVTNQNYFPKSAGDAFSNPDLIKFLNQNEIGEVIIAGVYAEACILATVKGAMRNQLKVKVLADGVGSKSSKKRQICLGKYREIGAETIETHQIIGNI